MSNRYYELSMLVLRVALGAIFLAHGLQKITGFEGIVKFFGSIGLPPILAYVVTTIETLGGACLILGLFTRTAATGICFVMLGAIFSVKASKGFINGYEFELSLLAAAVALILSGSNTLALGNLFSSLKATSAKKTA
ncbi:DoxX family protein [Sporomusa sp.]|uniref:DoxX family protein n=1 Tax=Sporomusa sp. TaxID=2078658 RepID=UPI002C84641E|nr:DoxX family protein [Sporomusa sp.]HWR42138.1 DoxX family protein [Sporomusa sp.]